MDVLLRVQGVMFNVRCPVRVMAAKFFAVATKVKLPPLNV